MATGLRERALAASAEQTADNEKRAREGDERNRKEIVNRGATTIRSTLKVEEVGHPVAVVVTGTSGFGALGHADWMIDGLLIRWKKVKSSFDSYGHDELVLVRECPKCGKPDEERLSFLYSLGYALEHETHVNGCPRPQVEPEEWGTAPILPPPAPTAGERIEQVMRDIAYGVVEETRQVES